MSSSGSIGSSESMGSTSSAPSIDQEEYAPLWNYGKKQVKEEKEEVGIPNSSVIFVIRNSKVIL